MDPKSEATLLDLDKMQIVGKGTHSQLPANHDWAFQFTNVKLTEKQVPCWLIVHLIDSQGNMGAGQVLVYVDGPSSRE